MLYTPKTSQNSGDLLSMSVIFTLISAFLFSSSCIAEDVLMIPAYENAFFEDGYSRWSQNRRSTDNIIFTTHISFEDLKKQREDAIFLRSQQKFGRFDRTSNHLPVSYNISVKGYSLYHTVENSTLLWSFDKVDLPMLEKPALFFGVQKTFR